MYFVDVKLNRSKLPSRVIELARLVPDLYPVPVKGNCVIHTVGGDGKGDIMITLQKKTEIRGLLMKDDKEVGSWLEGLSDIPDYMVEPFESYCHWGCDVRRNDGCNELSCFVAWFEYNPQEFREQLVMSHNNGYWNNGKLLISPIAKVCYDRDEGRIGGREFIQRLRKIVG